MNQVSQITLLSRQWQKDWGFRMGNSLIAFLVAVSATVWVYTKMDRKTGGNIKSTAIVAGTAGLFAFLLVFFALGLIPA